MCIILVLDATYVPNLTFFGLLSPETSLGEKPVTYSQTHSDTHPAYFAIHEPKTQTPAETIPASPAQLACR